MGGILLILANCGFFRSAFFISSLIKMFACLPSLSPSIHHAPGDPMAFFDDAAGNQGNRTHSESMMIKRIEELVGSGTKGSFGAIKRMPLNPLKCVKITNKIPPILRRSSEINQTLSKWPSVTWPCCWNTLTSRESTLLHHHPRSGGQDNETAAAAAVASMPTVVLHMISVP